MNASPLHVLIIEDSPNSRDLLCEMLALLGHQVQAVATGEEGIERIKSEQFDVLLTDINLPGMSGIELALRAVRIAPNIKIIFASGYGFLIADKTDFPFLLLPKPYTLTQLKLTLNQVAALPHHIGPQARF